MKICFVAHFALRALTGSGLGHIGGVERQTAMMARWFAAKGHSVSVLVWDEGQAAELDVSGVTVIKICSQDAGLPGLRFFTPRWTSLVGAMARADADIYYHNCAEYVTGQIALWTKMHRRKFAYSVASNPDCDPNLPTLRTYRERKLYRYGLRSADVVIVQTELQKKMLLDGFAIPSKVLPMPCEAPVGSPVNFKNTQGDPRRVLWIGRLAPEKRAHLVADVAALCPQLEFDVVGPDGTNAGYLESFRRLCAGVKNINLVGAVNFSEAIEYYKRAAVLCCTSEFEGFPNTFLEAWSQGRPVVSTVDPDGVIERFNLGRTAGTSHELGAVLTEYLRNDSALSKSSDNAVEYYSSKHEQNIAMAGFEKLLSSLSDSQ